MKQTLFAKHIIGNIQTKLLIFLQKCDLLFYTMEYFFTKYSQVYFLERNKITCIKFGLITKEKKQF